ncbi:hypothetical protein DFH09DRAFT_1250058 [Mycena vulgaris]|nr:hypothetical protein DFH09DRAFT_1250058 [Mycena vulgaris]
MLWLPLCRHSFFPSYLIHFFNAAHLSTPRPLVDSHGRILAVLAGQPRHDTYHEAAQRAFRAIRDAGNAARFPASMRRHRCGLFAAINPRLHCGGRYRACDVKLRKNHPDLRRPFAHSVFFCAAFNFGRNVWTFKHRDVLNLAFGWCAVQALGDFDPKKGGHLVLWDLKLVVEFPPGALILLPSATIAHSNVPVGENEERVSFTQFSAGGIFRYVDNGCRTEKELVEEDSEDSGTSTDAFGLKICQ